MSKTDFLLPAKRSNQITRLQIKSILDEVYNLVGYKYLDLIKMATGGLKAYAVIRLDSNGKVIENYAETLTKKEAYHIISNFVTGFKFSKTLDNKDK